MFSSSIVSIQRLKERPSSSQILRKRSIVRMHQQQKHQHTTSHSFKYNISLSESKYPVTALTRPSSELQKREHLSAKLPNSQSNQSINSLHINHLNLDCNNTSNSRLNNRNKSASNDHLNQLSNTNNHFRVSNSVTKNYLDFNLQQQQQQQQTQQPQAAQQQTPLYQINNRVQSSRTVYQANHNLKIINDSNKFLEDIIAHSKRNINMKASQTTASSQSQQSVSLSSSIQLPANVTIINRNSEEKAMFPDKLIMDRKNLICCPIIEGEDSLKLINYQHNSIRSIQNLDQMRNLIFLDLYDNKIEKIFGLSSLINLRVLMLGKNRIQKIENLTSLVYLDILDLHGNQCELEYCTRLQRLFLSYNEIFSLDCIKNLNQIKSIQELTLDNNPISLNDSNYKRNVLTFFNTIRKLDSKRVTDEEKRIAEKIFMKELNKKREIDTMAIFEHKRKLTIKDAQNEWINQQQQLQAKSLASNKTFLDETESNHYAESKNDEYTSVDSDKLSKNTKDLDLDPMNGLTINNLTSSSSSSSFNSLKEIEDKNNDDDSSNLNLSVQKNSSGLISSRGNSATSVSKYNQAPKTNNNNNNNNNNNSNSTQGTSKKSTALNNGSNIHEENIMFFYGNKSLEIIDIKLEPNVQSQITTISFFFIDFDEYLCKSFVRLKIKFPQVTSLAFTCCNIRNLNQLDYLLDWKRLDSITINNEDNPIFSISIWKYYVLSRLNTLQLKRINNNLITESELSAAHKLFFPLRSWIVLIPEYKLISILGIEKKKLIKIAKENSNDQSSPHSKQEQIAARDVITKTVLASNQLLHDKRFPPNKSNLFTNNNLIMTTTTENKRINKTQIQTKSLLNSLFSQMTYNDVKKKKITQNKRQIWNQFLDTCLQNTIENQAYVSNLCKQHKIFL